MKIIFLFLLTPLMAFSTVSAQNSANQSDWQLVENTIQLYFDGWATGDTNRLGRAMHFSCRLKNYRDGKFLEYDKATYLGFFKPRPRPKNLQTRIVSIDITDIIGSAKTEIITETEIFTDYFNLMKTDEGWFIVDKVAVRTPKGSVQAIKAELNVNPVKEYVFENLKRPWSIAFLTEDEALVAEKEGDLVKVNLATKQKVVIKGFPDDRTGKRVEYSGENDGLFEVLLDPNFNENKFVYVSYAARNQEGTTTTKVIRGVLENDSLSQVQTIFVATPYTSERYHYGGGMTFGRDGKLYVTIGERLFKEIDEPPLPIAQNVEDKRGKIYRLNPDGTIPKDNPYFSAKAVPGLYALGIRAAQGITVQPLTGQIWFSEHGTHQGDEINILKANSNYGWSVKTAGKYRSENYVPPPMKDTVFTDPVWFWQQTVAPTGLVFYTGDEFPLWKNNLIVAGLGKGSLWRFEIEGETIKSVEELFVNDRVRFRKAAQSPAGKLYLLTDEMNGKVIRIRNANAK